MKGKMRLLAFVMTLVVCFNVAASTYANQISAPIEGKVLVQNLTAPLRITVGDQGEVYILDGTVLKKYHNGKVNTVADLVKSAEYFKPYGLGEIHDLYTFRPGAMSYMDGAVYVMGYMVDLNLPPIIKPNYYTGVGDHGTGVILGTAYLLMIKITDRFEPVDVPFYGKHGQRFDNDSGYPLGFRSAGTEIALSKHEYDQLLLGDPLYTKNWRYVDYTALYRNTLSIPNLVKTPDGNLMTIKPTGMETWLHSGARGYYNWDYLYSNTTLQDIKNILDEIYAPRTKATSSTTTTHASAGAYVIYPDGRQKRLDTGYVSLSPQKHQYGIRSLISIFNKYGIDKTDIFPDNNTVYALPSYVDPDNTLIICNSTYIWTYNLKNFTATKLELIPGNQMKSSPRQVLIPSLHYASTHPRPTKDLGIFFLGTGAVWRLYKDKYWQDLTGEGLCIPFETTIDWAIDEPNRIAYVLTQDKQLVSYDFSRIIAKTPPGTNQFVSSRPYNVMLDRERSTMYILDDDRRPPVTNDGKFYVPAETIFNLLGITAFLNQKIAQGNGFYLIPAQCLRRGRQVYIRGYVPEGTKYVQIWSDIVETLDAIYFMTGRVYTYDFDAATNTLYLNSAPNSVPLFTGWNNWDPR